MPSRWSPLPRSIHTRAELLERGIHPRRLASPEFLHVLPRHYTPAADPAPLEILARILQRRVLPGSVISHDTAATILGLPLPLRFRRATPTVGIPDDPDVASVAPRSAGIVRATGGVRTPTTVHVTLRPGDVRRAGPHVRVHTRRDFTAQWVAGIEVIGVVDLLCQLSPELRHGELVAMCDHLVGLSIPPGRRMSLQLLTERIAAAGPVHGIAAVRRALLDARPGVESPKESELRLLLVGAGFAEPEINLPIRAEGSGESFRLDLAFPEQHIAVEYDGDWHRTDRDRFRRDRRKDDVLHELG